MRIQRRFLVAAAALAAVIAAIYSLLAPSPSDRRFQAVILDVMPGFELSERILGRTFEVSDTYSVEYGEGADSSDGIRQVAQKFIAQHDADGLPQVDLLFRTGLMKSELYWRVSFPGCIPGACDGQIDDDWISEIDESTWIDYSSAQRKWKPETVWIAEQEFDGLRYWATVSVRFDGFGRVIRYEVSSHRDVRNALEGLFAKIADGNDNPVVHTIVFEKNLVLAR